jgi:hypothetical protein
MILIARALALGDVCEIPFPLVCYRSHAGSLTNSGEFSRKKKDEKLIKGLQHGVCIWNSLNEVQEIISTVPVGDRTSLFQEIQTQKKQLEPTLLLIKSSIIQKVLMLIRALMRNNKYAKTIFRCLQFHQKIKHSVRY